MRFGYLHKMETPVKIYSYIMTSDSGFSPNPFHGFLTLAVCKPKIRQNAAIGDWVFGFSSKTNKQKYGPFGPAVGNKLVFAMEIKGSLTFQEYWKDARFQSRKANFALKDEIWHCGDNFYEPTCPNPTSLDHWTQHESYHSEHHQPAKQALKDKKNDLSVNRVLYAENFYYFGSEAIENRQLFETFFPNQHFRGFRCLTDQNAVKGALAVLKDYQPRRIYARPSRNRWKLSDASWQHF